MYLVLSILVFSFLIFIHEFGHFITAKLSGVRVNEFSMFMGPAIFKKQVGETLYAIRCIPFGGYCAMEGEDDDSEDPRSFGKAAWWKRLLILVAGSGMNFISGFIILALITACLGGAIVPVISQVEEGSLVGGPNGFQAGDEIYSIDGDRVFVQSDFSMILYFNPGEVHDVVVVRDGQKVLLDNFVMKTTEFTDDEGNKSQRYGIVFSVEYASVPMVLTQSWKECMSILQQVKMSLEMMFTGKIGLQDMSGPVGIVDVMVDMGEQAESFDLALLNILNLGAYIAVNLAMMNMLPIPALDGGRVVALLLTTGIEKITGKKVNPKYEAYIHGAGMVLLLGLMAIILFKDVFTIVTR